MGDMGEMMKGMGAPKPKDFYPTLMDLPDLPLVKRLEVEQQAGERMHSGVALMNESLDKLLQAASVQNYTAMQAGTASLREGLARFESGLAAQRALAEGKAPRDVALTWFKRDMNLLPLPDEEPRALHGVTPFHLFTMVLLIAFALAMVAMYFFKMRRAAALFGRIDADKGSPPPGSSPPLPGGPGPSSPSAPPNGKTPPPEGTPPPSAPPSPSPAAPLAEKSPASGPPAASTSPTTPAAGTPPASDPLPGGSSAVPVPREDAGSIAGRACELWEARGRPMGSPEIDWFGAEEELAKAADKPPAPPVAGGSPASPATPPAVSEAASAPPLTANWRGQLRIGSIVTETPGVKTFRLLPSSSDPFLPFTFVPGQFLNVAFSIGGARMNRSYSISSSPTQREYVDLTVKREPRGAVSRHINDLLRVGNQIEAAGPVGKFTFNGTEAESIVLIAAGVGITPMASISRYLTERAWPGDVYFLYACRTPADYIFEKEIVALQLRNPKLHVTVTMSKPEGTDWKGPRGRITKELLTKTVPELTKRRFHICGPAAMMDATKALLIELGVPPEQVKMELFGATKPAIAPVGTTAKPTVSATGPMVTFSRNNKSAKIHSDQTILELSEELAIGIENSCRIGTCGVCKVKMTSGDVEMAVEDALDADDKVNGIILACQAKPKGEVTVEA
jgi:ferredoxin-NADP reductase